ncbi:MAG: Lrp/AsnC family transcriptional regulator, partial [Pseudomonadota bacterium]|nr:Lrp/AsnC family transcriptional regulator [Pseudomonadota bacterium]
YYAEIDVYRLANTITVFTEITIADQRRENFTTFEKRSEQFPEVVECHLISGGYDYLLKFVSRIVLDYQSSTERLLDAQIGIEKYFSHVVIKSPIDRQKPKLSNIVGIN